MEIINNSGRFTNPAPSIIQIHILEPWANLCNEIHVEFGRVRVSAFDIGLSQQP